ncbi:hypothetical protein V7O66_05160 [Methanolobus sp. ZRKC3]|uniref:hypothetical protein n=1 Tax=Methanolobus sp. ZRKC3 TaxID=3125786 RepID=UPI003243ED13
MSRVRFSKDYRTYGQWLKAQPRDTRYAKEIIRKHKLNPSATLSNLRKTRVSDISPASKPFAALTPVQRDMRTRSLYALNNVRKGKSLSTAAKEQGISVQDALKHLGNSVHKKNGRWVATKTDSIERGRWLYSNGKRVSVVVKNSRDASLISKYLNAVRTAIRTGDEAALKPFKNVTIQGADGKDYPLETDLEKLYVAEERIEDDEFLPIYDDRN